MLSRQDLRDKQELLQILLSIQDFHGCAYGWKPEVTADSIYAATEAGGCLLRTKIRAAIEFFDQLHQYGEADKTKITEPGKESFDEEDTLELPGLECLIISSKQNKYSLKKYSLLRFFRKNLPL